MNLLCWSATFGADSAHDSLLAEPRATADAAIGGSWVPHDRASLGVLYYRGTELLRAIRRALRIARARSFVSRRKAIARRRCSTSSLSRSGYWAEAERRCGQAERAARARARGRDDDGGRAPEPAQRGPGLSRAARRLRRSLLAPRSETGDRARHPRLVTRVHGLAGTPYAQGFLTQLAPNAGLLAAAEAYGLVPGEIAALIAKQG